jgi:hypothetical protein
MTKKLLLVSLIKRFCNETGSISDNTFLLDIGVDFTKLQKQNMRFLGTDYR